MSRERGHGPNGRKPYILWTRGICGQTKKNRNIQTDRKPHILGWQRSWRQRSIWLTLFSLVPLLNYLPTRPREHHDSHYPESTNIIVSLPSNWSFDPLVCVTQIPLVLRHKNYSWHSQIFSPSPSLVAISPFRGWFICVDLFVPCALFVPVSKVAFPVRILVCHLGFVPPLNPYPTSHQTL